MKNSLLLVASFFALTLGISSAHATAIPSGSYTTFTFGVAGSYATSTYTETGAGTVTILDGYDDGDQFAVYDNGIFLGNTSTPVNDGTSCYANTTACYANLDFSRATFALGAGLNTISIMTLKSPYGAGGAFIGANVESLPISPAPEPSSLVLLGTGILGAAGAVRRRIRA